MRMTSTDICFSDESSFFVRTIGLDVHTQHPETLNICLELVQYTVDPVLTDIPGHNDHYNENKFQQHGAPPHYTLAVRFSVERVLVGRSAEWLPRSPDLNA